MNDRSGGIGLPDQQRDAAEQLLAAMVAEHAERLSREFYDVMLADPASAAFLDNQLVRERLGASLAGWLRELFPGAPLAADGLGERQRRIGQVHARIRIPIDLVLGGAAQLKAAMARTALASACDERVRTVAIMLLGARIDLAMRQMSAAYVTSALTKERSDEAYRLMTLGQDVSIERERQRGALMEWSQGVLFAVMGRGPSSELVPLGRSDFGLWCRHQAVMLFAESAPMVRIQELIDQVDGAILPGIAVGDGALARHVGQLQQAVEEIRFLLDSLFQSVSHLEMGTDPLTRVLNRRFLASILGRELAMAGEMATPLTVLMIDVDHFKSINDRLGHAAGDQVLRELASTIVDAIRRNDYVFRLGGEEFLVVLVETPEDQAVQIAERLRRHFAATGILVPGHGRQQATISIG